ncbi:MAG: methionyl-tRNA formyltransferase [Flavobacteriaceae bacterium]|jgi:methionyl-tRNA formyltransferase
MNRRIIFFGTPPFAVRCLEKMMDQKFEVVAVVTAPDRPAGRGRKMSPSAVKLFSKEHNIPIYQPSNLKKPEFIDQLKVLKPDLMIVVAFRMLPKEVWSLPSKGTFNLHASLLPDYRGAAPINWAIINREKQSGVSTFYLNEQIDAGAILLQESVKIDDAETAGSLHDKLARAGSELICKTIEGIFEGTINPKKQQWKGTEKTAPKLTKENVFIDWDLSLEDIHAKIRGLSPYPGAKSHWIENQDSSVIKIYDAEILEERHDFKSKQVIIRNQKILIAHSNGFLNCKSLQLPNKRKMSAKDLLNGSDFSTQLRVS